MKDAVQQSVSTLLPQQKKDEKDWVTDTVRQLSAQKREAWIRWKKGAHEDDMLREEYYRLKREVKVAVQEARDAWWESVTQELEKKYEMAIKCGAGGSILKDLKALHRRQKPQVNSPLMASNGKDKLLTDEGKLGRWQEHFEKISNIPTHVSEETLSRTPVCHLPGGEELIRAAHGLEDIEDLAKVPEIDEVCDAVNGLKNNKAPGADEITAEYLNLGGDVVVTWMSNLISTIWEKEYVPVDWLKQLTVPIHKKGSYDDCDNYRGIALLSVPGKVLCKVIQNRLKKVAESTLRENQCGFRGNRGCIDQLFTLRLLMEKAREFHSPLYLCFIDLKKAYDSVNREALWAVLRKRYHLPQKLLSIIEALHTGTLGAVRAYGRCSQNFSITNGVRQGDVMAPTLFNLFFDAVIIDAMSKHTEHGPTVLFHPDAGLVGSRKQFRNSTCIQDLEYADDMCVVSDLMEVLQEMIQDMDRCCSDMSLAISSKKTKILAVCSEHNEIPHQVDLPSAGGVIEVVDHFDYLGSRVTSTCDLDAEINCRVSKASASFRSLSPVLWYQRGIKVGTKLRMFKAAILPVLLYGSETWAPMSKHVERLQSFVMRCVRIILRVSLWEKQRNSVLRGKACLEKVETMLRRNRLRWLGHVARMNIERIPRMLLVSKPATGKRTVGGQKLRWADVVSGDLRKCGIEENWRLLAQEREKYRVTVDDKLTELNEAAEREEEAKKDEKKRRREQQNETDATRSAFTCDVTGCGFVARNRAGLTNHQRQKHSQQVQQECQYCKKVMSSQGLRNHKVCSANPKNKHSQHKRI